ncbi:MAG: hypothetical protein PW792_03370 [Acidobacteriaceae bacterium]|nr:hypothetical protein [Acidobacteriaceae bacterium]
MKFGRIVGLGLALLGCAAAHAQLSIYGTYTASRHTGLTCLDSQNECSGTENNAAGDHSSRINLTGGWGGVSYDWKKYGPAMIGFDLRAGEGHANRSATSSAGGAGATASQNVLAGVKASFHTPIHALKPYAQVSAGWARSNLTEPFGTTTVSPTSDSPVPPAKYDNFFQVEGFVGADIKIFPVLDLRIIELGIGNMNRLGNGSGASSVGVMSAGVGVVFHFPSAH